MKGMCPKCHRRKDLTIHHCIPKRLKTGIEEIVYLCRDCHDWVEVRIKEAEHSLLRRNLNIYWQVVAHIRGG